MKSKILSVTINVALAAIVLAVGFIGFWGGSAAAVSYKSDNLYYGGDENGNCVTLTFNVYEGTEIVEQILNILDEHGAKATFFIGGAWADDNIDCVREIYRRGHELGSHGYFHKDHSKMSYEANLEEIRPSVKLLEMICGQKITLFAPPSGAFAENTINACVELGLKVIMWSRDTIDWRDKDVSLIVNRATLNLNAGEIILMHPKEQTVKALPTILNYIREQGLTADTVSRNLGEK
ncbi:MAG: polysaccharide deacetylase family protein [Clostridiales bacterium]|nr:polysaccharide deacetylase family protein [Clostridiales bacterium]